MKKPKNEMHHRHHVDSWIIHIPGTGAKSNIEFRIGLNKRGNLVDQEKKYSFYVHK